LNVKQNLLITVFICTCQIHAEKTATKPGNTPLKHLKTTTNRKQREYQLYTTRQRKCTIKTAAYDRFGRDNYERASKNH